MSADEDEPEDEQVAYRKEHLRTSIHQDNEVAVLMERENRQHRSTLAELFKVGRQKGLFTGITKYGG